MRRTRIMKFRKKNFKLSLVLKTFSIAYLCLLVTTYSTNDTNAFLNDTANSQAQFKAQWEEIKDPPNKHGDWDKSSLKFINQGGNCNEIFSVVQNGKDSGPMNENLRYEVFYNEKGNPKNGQMIFKSEMEPLKNGQEARLTFTPGKAGKYMFKAYQHQDHPGNGELWSKEIQVSCKAPSKPKENNPSTNIETQDESTTPTTTEKKQEEITPPTEEEPVEENTKTQGTPAENEVDTTTNEANQVKNHSNQSQESTNTNDGQN